MLYRDQIGIVFPHSLSNHSVSHCGGGSLRAPKLWPLPLSATCLHSLIDLRKGLPRVHRLLLYLGYLEGPILYHIHMYNMKFKDLCLRVDIPRIQNVLPGPFLSR